MTSEGEQRTFVRFQARRERKFKSLPDAKLNGRIAWISKQIQGLQGELEELRYELNQRAL